MESRYHVDDSAKPPQHSVWLENKTSSSHSNLYFSTQRDPTPIRFGVQLHSACSTHETLESLTPTLPSPNQPPPSGQISSHTYSQQLTVPSSSTASSSLPHPNAGDSELLTETEVKTFLSCSRKGGNQYSHITNIADTLRKYKQLHISLELAMERNNRNAWAWTVSGWELGRWLVCKMGFEDGRFNWMAGQWKVGRSLV